MEVENNRVVSVRYLMKNSKGEVLENRMESTPVTYLHGAGSILPSLEDRLLGLKKGEEKTFSVFDGQNNDEKDAGYSLKVVIDEVRLPTNEELIQGYPNQNKEENCGPDCGC